MNYKEYKTFLEIEGKGFSPINCLIAETFSHTIEQTKLRLNEDDFEFWCEYIRTRYSKCDESVRKLAATIAFGVMSKTLSIYSNFENIDAYVDEMIKTFEVK